MRGRQNLLYPYSTTRSEKLRGEALADDSATSLPLLLERSLSHFHQGTVVKCAGSLFFVLALIHLITDGVLTFFGVWFLQEGNPLISSWMKRYGVGSALLLKTVLVGGMLYLIKVLFDSSSESEIRRVRWVVINGLLLCNAGVIGGWFIGALGLTLPVFPGPLVLFALSFGLLPFLFVRELGREVTLLSSLSVSGAALLLSLHIVLSPILITPVIDGKEVTPDDLKRELGLLPYENGGRV